MVLMAVLVDSRNRLDNGYETAWLRGLSSKSGFLGCSCIPKMEPGWKSPWTPGALNLVLFSIDAERLGKR